MTPEELRDLIEQTGLSQERFANCVIGVSAGTVSNWLNGKSPIPWLKAVGIQHVVIQWLRERLQPS